MQKEPCLIYINGRFLSQPATGVQRFAREIMQALDKVLEEEAGMSPAYHFICLVPSIPPEGSLPDWKNIHIQKCGRLNGNLWEQIELPFYARNGLLVDLCNIGPIFHFDQVVVIHDASIFAVPAAYSLTFKAKYRVIMWILGRTARQILTVSQFSKNELARYLKINKEKITTISEGCEHILNTDRDDSILKDERFSHKPFLLAVGSSSPHKNVRNIIDAIENSTDESMILVIAGGSYAKVFKSQKSFESASIIHLGYVSDGALRSLYSQALGFVFPSIYEGFGLPPLEAMVCGCPVMASNAASIPEVCGDAAIYFDPLSSEEINNRIQLLMNDSSLRSSLIQKGYERVKHFTWEKSAQDLFEILKKYFSS